MVRDLTDGLAYLHGKTSPVRHGDLKTRNILINGEVRAVLADSGLSKALGEGPTGLTTSDSFKGTLRYCSPEVVKDSASSHSLPSDIWAWACLILEVLMDTIPYAEKKSPHSIIFALVSGELPAQAADLFIPVSGIKLVLGQCWAVDPCK